MLKYFIKKVFANVTKPFSVNKTYNELRSLGYKISNKYLYEYLSHCHAIFLAQAVNKFHFSEIKQEKADKKVYVIDNGLLTAVDFNISQNKGKLFENMTAMEFIKLDCDVFYFKDKYECDFIVKEGTNFIPIQAAYNLDDNDTLQREFRGLHEACNYLNVNTGIILTFDDEREFDYLDIKVQAIPFYKYFLN